MLDLRGNANLPLWSERFVPVSLLSAMFVFSVFPMIDHDFWWHLRTGQLMVERGGVPRTDWFLFSDSDRAWIDLHYGFQLLLTGLYTVGGVNLVILFKASLLTVVVGICWSIAGRGLPAWVRFLCWTLGALCIAGRVGERPEILTLFFLSLWLWIAARVEQNRNLLWILPGLQVLWVNCHALFVLGLVVGTCFAVDHCMRLAARGRWGLEPVTKGFSTRSMFFSGGLCLFASFCNPYFLDGALFPLTLYRKFSVEQEFYSTRVMEFETPCHLFARIGFSGLYLDAEIVLAIATAISLMAVVVIGHKWSPFRWLLFACFSHLGWEAIRNINLFGIVAGTILVTNLAEMKTHWLIIRSDSSDGRNKSRSSRRRPTSQPIPMVASISVFDGVANLILAIVVTARTLLSVFGLMGNLTNERGGFALGEQPYWFGHEAMQFAGQSNFPDRAVVGHIGMAAVYEFHNGPERKVMIDPRLEVSTPMTFLFFEYILGHVQLGDRGWETPLKDSRGNLPAVILDTRSSFHAITGMLKLPGWRLVYADPAAGVFLTDRQADALNLPRADPAPLMNPP